MGYLSKLALVAACGAFLAAILYLLAALVAVYRHSRRPRGRCHYPEPITILKPVCGVEPGLYENLRSFCVQDYSCYQVVFGLGDAEDPALGIIERVRAELPDRDLAVVVDPKTIGTNLKISNLANMQPLAKYQILTIADSDMRVDPRYLSELMACFEDPEVGAVTCLYKGTPTGGLASRLGAMFINEWFFPSVVVALSIEKLRYCFGATMAVRRDILKKIGGFEALAAELADDHLLGKWVSRQGHTVRLAPYIIENIVHEETLKQLFLHELRWARTVRCVRPGGHAFSFVTYAIPMSVFFLMATHLGTLGLAAVALALGLRMLLHVQLGALFSNKGYASVWLIPLRDLLSFAVWCGSFFGRRVHWRDHSFNLNPEGRLVQEGKVIP